MVYNKEVNMSKRDLMSIEGIDEDLAEKLIAAGIRNVWMLANTSVSKLVHYSFGIELPLQTAKDIIATAQERVSSLSEPKTGEQLVQDYQNRAYLTSGTKGLDAILESKGFQTQRIYELYGPEGAGKADLLHQLVCTAYLPPDQGGLGAGSIYIDTEGMFSWKQIDQLAQRFQINYEALKRNILKASTPNTESLLFFIEAELERFAYERGARLFCLDNLAAPFLAEYDGVGPTLPERQQKVNKVIHALKRAAEHYNGVVIYTNQIKSDGTHYLGNIAGHEAHIRIFVDIIKASSDLRLFKIEKALDIAPGETILKLTPEGFVDPSRKPYTSRTKSKLPNASKSLKKKSKPKAPRSRQQHSDVSLRIAQK
jgi:RecA/RadA recombinase